MHMHTKHTHTHFLTRLLSHENLLEILMPSFLIHEAVFLCSRFLTVSIKWNYWSITGYPLLNIIVKRVYSYIPKHPLWAAWVTKFTVSFCDFYIMRNLIRNWQWVFFPFRVVSLWTSKLEVDELTGSASEVSVIKVCHSRYSAMMLHAYWRTSALN